VSIKLNHTVYISCL